MTTHDEVLRFIDWLYERGPDPMSMTREKLLCAYEVWVLRGAVLDEAFAYERLSGK